MRTVSRFVLNSALIVSSMTGVGCAVTSPRMTAFRQGDCCDCKMNAALLEENRGNLEAARRQYVAIHKQFPQNAECLHRLAVISVAQMRLDEADAYYLQSYGLDPNNASLLGDMGYAAFLKKDYERAEMFLDKSVQLNNQDRVVLYNLGIARAWREKDADSLAAFRMIYGEVESIRHLATVQDARGDHERSRKNIELAARMDSQGANVALNGTQVAPSSSVQSPSAETYRIETTAYQPAAPNDPLISIKVPLLTASQATGCSMPDRVRFAHAPVETPASPPEFVIVAEVNQEVSQTQSQMLAPPGSWTTSDDAFPTVAADPMDNLFEAGEAAAERSGVVIESEAKSAASEAYDQWNNAVEESVTISSTDVPRASESRLGLSGNPTIAWRKSVSETHPTTQNGVYVKPLKSDVTKIPLAQANSKSMEHHLDLKGICLVTLFEERRITRSSAEFSAEFQAQKYCFTSAEARDKFLTDPLRYVPVAGGLDIVSVRNAKVVEQGSIEFAVWYKRQLYLFTCTEHAEAFRNDPHQYVSAN